jgi:hypothetical protein
MFPQERIVEWFAAESAEGAGDHVDWNPRGNGISHARKTAFSYA